MTDFSFSDLESLIRRHRGDLNGEISFQRIRTGKFNTSFFVRAGDE